MTYPRIEKMKVSDLRPADYNPRTIADSALSGLTASIERFGMVEPPVFNKRTGTLVGGHQRLKVMIDQGMQTVDVVVVDVDEIEEKALNVTLNNPEIAGTFTDGLQDLLAEIAEHDDEWMDALNLDALVSTPEIEPEDEAPDGGGDDDRIPTRKRKKFKDGQSKNVGRHKIICGDCVDALRAMPDASVDAIVTDPPYGIGFMGRDWDVAVPGLEWAQECLRVLKPGGHIIAFAATRTVHRLAVAIEDAGFEIRDTISWLQFQGFPKSLDIAKEMDKRDGIWRGNAGSVKTGNGSMSGPNYERTDKGAPVTDDAKRWDGWGTALKPAQEPAILARKPLDGTVAENVITHGTGGLNIDGCRMAYGDPSWPGPGGKPEWSGEQGWREQFVGGETGSLDSWQAPDKGRWPANIYVCPKPAGSEKNDGLEHLDTLTGGQATDRKEGSKGLENPRAGAGRNGGAKNFHPTVKPVRLMRWLIRLVTPPGGVVVDTFLGSGTTMVAAEREGFDCIGIEMSGEFAALSEARVLFAVGSSTSESE